MRLNKITKEIIWGLILIVLAIISFNFMEVGELTLISIGSGVTFFLVCFFFWVWSLSFNDLLRDILSFKYKLIKNKYHYEIKYLTSWWLFIPCWKPIETITKWFDYKNIFGGDECDYYTSEVTYSNEQEALSAIKKHKEKLKENWIKYCEIPKKIKKDITYI